MSNYWKKKMEELNKSSSSSSYWKSRLAELEEEEQKKKTEKKDEDIAPVKKQEDSWWQKVNFDDGYQFGEISKTILGNLSRHPVFNGKDEEKVTTSEISLPDVMNYAPGIGSAARQSIYDTNKKRIQEIDNRLANTERTLGDWVYENVPLVRADYTPDTERNKLLAEKKKLEEANAHYDKYGNAYDLTYEELIAKRDSAENNTDSLYYRALANQKWLENQQTALSKVELEGEKTNLLDAMKKLAEMEDGKEKDNRKDFLREKVNAAGFEFDNIYSLITGDSNVTSDNFWKWAGATADLGLAGWNKGVGATLDVLLKGVGWEDNPISALNEHFTEVYENDAFNSDFYAQRMGGGKGFQYGGELISGTTGALPDALLAIMTSGASAGSTTTTSSLQQAAAFNSGSALTKAGLTVSGMAKKPTFWSSFVRTYGEDYESAKELGASDEVATFGALLTSFANAGVEIGLDGMSGYQGLTEALASGNQSKVLAFVESILEEAGEEPLQGVITRSVNKALYGSEEKVFDAETIFKEAAIGGGVGAILGGSQVATDAAISSIPKKVTYTENEQKVIDKVVADRIAESEKDGTKLTNKDKATIEKQVKDELEKGDIPTDTIEEVLGGETYKAYKETVDSEDALQKEYDELRKVKTSESTLEQQERYRELKQQLADMEKTSNRKQLKSKLSEEVLGLVQGDRLVESYNEKGRRSQAFEADLSKYSEKERVTVQRAIDSGILNNTNKSHRFVDLIAKVSAEKGVPFDFANNAKLKESGFALKGVTVNGFVNSNGVTINIDSAKALNSVVGHEITHVLEGTEFYETLKTTIEAYAKSKGEYDSRLETLQKLYEGKEGYTGEDAAVKIEQELVADLVGDYLFTDTEFVNRLSTENRGLFQKVFDEVKYLCKVATAGSKEARQLEKVKKAFEDAYRMETKNPTENGGVKYSLTEKITPSYEELVAKEPVQIVNVKGGIESGSYAKMKDAAMNKAKSEGWFDKPHHNSDTDGLIFLTEKSFSHAYSNLRADFGEDTIRCMAHIPEIIQNAVLVSVDAPRDPTKQETKVYTFFGAIEGVAGIEPVKLTVKEYDFSVLEAVPKNIRSYFEKNGAMGNYDSLYDTHALEVVGIESAKKESDASGRVYEQISEAQATSDSKISVTNLLGLVKGDAQKYIPKASHGTIDQAYTDAVSRGDTKTAQKMVDEAAKKAGYVHTMFHETDAENIHIFDVLRGDHGGTDYETPYGIFTKTSDKNIGLGNRQMKLFVKALNTLRVENRADVRNKIPGFMEYYDQIQEIDRKYDALAEQLEDEEFDALQEWMEANPDADMDVVYPTSYITDGKPADIDSKRYQEAHQKYQENKAEWQKAYDAVAGKAKGFITSYLRRNEYDSMYFKVDGGSRGRQTDSLIVLDPNQVKSADPITYDDKGNVIPLSERFDSSKNDIRYSLSEHADVSDDLAPLPGNIYGKDVALQEVYPDDYAPVREDIPALNDRSAQKADGLLDDNLREALESFIREDAATERNESGEDEKTAQKASKTAQILFGERQTQKQKSAWKWAREHIFSHGAVFEDLSLKTGNRELQARFDNIRRAESRAQNFIGNGKGKVKALVDIRNTVEKAGKTEDFNNYLYHLHNIDRMTLEKRFEGTSNKAVFGDSVDAEVSRKAAINLETLNPEFKQWAEEVYAINKHLRQMMVDEGIISQETADLWQNMYPHYVPISRAGAKGLSVNVPLDTKRTGVNAPIKKATGGNSDFYNVFDTMGSRIEQTYKAIAKNRFGVELMNTLGTAFDNKQADIETVLENIDSHEELLQEGKNGESPTFTVFQSGEKVTFAITEDMYDAMKPSQFTYTNKALRKINDVRRDVLTAYSPTFALTNPIKDIQDILLNSQHPARTYATIPEAIKSVITKDRWYQERMEHGGNQDTYFDSQTKTFKKEDGWFKKAMGFVPGKIQLANEMIEQVPRMAEYIASRKMGRSIDVSMLDAARVTTNFGAAGDLTNMLNRNGFTFLGASVEGFNQQIRNVREAKAEGVKGWAKLTAKYLVAGLPALLQNCVLWDDDEEYEELSDYVKQNYYVIAKTDSGRFIRIPKGRAVAVIQEAFAQMENLITGDDEVDTETFGQLVLNNLAPNNPMENNIIAPLAQAYKNETWYGDELVPTRLQEVPAAEQFDETTDSISRWLGDVTNTSPYKWNYLLDQYTGGIGDMVLPYLTPEADGGGLGAALRDKFTVDPILKNQNVSDFYDKMDELTVNANAMDATDDDVLMNKYMSAVNSELSKLYQQKREIQNSDMADEEKYAAVREIQSQIVDLAREGLQNYGDVKINGTYAAVGDKHYRLDASGEGSKTEWKKITTKQLEKQAEVTKSLNITPGEYWGNKEEFDFAYDNPEKHTVAKVIGGYKVYKKCAGELEKITADKDANGKSISGSKKEKVVAYINGLNIGYNEKLVLFKSEYPADDTYNYEIVKYLNGREDLSYKERETILKELGFEVDADGDIYW